MLKKSCQWWLIWYLLYICHGAEGQLQWVVKEKVTAYGQNLVLFCPVGNCCSEPAGWFVGSKSIILDVKTFSNDPKVKYHGTHNKDGFGVVIRNLSEADLNVTYRCVYGFNVSTPKYLLHGDVFREYVPDKDKEIDTAAIAVPIVVVMGGVIIGIMACCVYRIKKKRQEQKGTDKEKEVLYHPDMENQEDEADSLSKEGNNFVRLYFCQEIATQAVRFFFDRKVPVHTLRSFLKNNKSNLTDEKSLYKCSKEQEAKLFPVGQVVVFSTDFDFTLLYKLIRNHLTAISAPTSGWGNPPLPDDLNETDDIERILHVRNFLVNNSEFEICDGDFSTHWTDLSQAIVRLSKGSLSTAVESMRTKKFDKCKKNEMEEGLKELHEELMKLRQDMIECKTDIAKHIPSNIRKCHMGLIEQWKIDNQLFYKTVGFTAASEMVQSKHYMTIIGGPGSGKTATARHLAIKLEEKGWEVVPVFSLKDIIKYGDKNRKQVFVCDDVLGIFVADKNIYSHISDHKEAIFKAIGGTSKLLFTCRKTVYNEASKLGLFVTENIVDLQSKANQLTEKEKKEIFRHHCESKGLNIDLYTSLSFIKANHMFPFLCKIFSGDKEYQLLGESFFNKPFKYFNNELGKLQYKHTIQYAVLVLCLVNGGTLSVKHLPSKGRRNEVFTNCGVNLDTSKKDINDAIYNQSETYFTKLETKYIFTHDFIFEVIFYHYGCQNKHMILKYLSSSYIANKVTVYEQASDEDLCIHISRDMYLPLANRLYTDIQSMNLFDVFMNKSLQHGPFLDVFEAMLKTKPFDEFKSLILRKCLNISQLLYTTFSVNRPLRQMIDDIEYDRLNLLFDRVCHAKYDTECNVKVISWIIYYGHTHLLQEIVNHVKCNNHNINLVFGSDVMEKRRVLSLGCYSNTLDMVEFILQYVDPKCIDIDFTSTSSVNGHVTPLKVMDTDLTSTCASSKIDINVNTQFTPLGVACSVGNLDIVKALLKNQADINKCSKWNESPLFIASKHGQMDVVEYLIFSDADINLPDHFGKSPLFVATEKGYCDIVEHLHNHDADINIRSICGQSLLCVASEEGHRDVVNFLLKNCADINFRSNFGLSPLFVASQKGHCDVVKCLLKSGVDMNFRSNLGHSPLFVASQQGHCDVVKCLLRYHANINLHSNSGLSPLFVASQEGHCGVVECLLGSGADINLSDEVGRSSLFEAAYHGYCDVVKCLLNFGAHINLCDNIGQSSLFVASEEGHCGVVKCLLSYGADINLSDKYGQSPLFVASQRRHCDVVKCLLGSVVDINLRNVGGHSSLFEATYNGYYDVVKFLLSSSANINLCDEDRQSPLFVASNLGYCDVVKCLLNYGADINLCDERGQLPAIYYDIDLLLTELRALRDENDSNALLDSC